MVRRPAVRASNAHDLFEFLKLSYPDAHRHLKETLPSHVLDRIEGTVRTDWIDIEHDAEYANAVLRCLGPEETKVMIRRFFVQSLVRTPMMYSLFKGVQLVFGVSVGAFLRVVPSGFQQAYRDAFEMRLDRGDHEALLTLDDLAPEVLRTPYPIFWEGAFLGLYDLASAEPRLDYRFSRATRRIEAHFRW